MGRSVLLLALPMVLEMLFEAVFGLVDIFFVGRLGPEAVAVVGITESLLTLVFAIAVGLSVAATALVARWMGAGRPERAARVAGLSIGLALLCSVLTAAFGVPLAAPLLQLMGTTGEGIELGVPYVRWLFGGSATLYLIFLINAILRGAGMAMAALKVLWFANLVNLVLDPLLIFGWGPIPALGLEGAAIATNIGRACGIAYQCYILWKNAHALGLTRRNLPTPATLLTRTGEDRPLFAQLSSLATTAAMQSLIGTASWLGLVRILAFFGPAAVAGYTVALRILIFAILPSWGLSNATATLVGQSLGARKERRAEHAVWATGLLNLVFLTTIGLLFVLFAEGLTRLFTQDPEAIQAGAAALRFISYGFVFYAYGTVITQGMNGAGDTLTPTRIAFLAYWVVQIPCAFALALGLGLGPAGVFLAIPIAETLRALLALHHFRKGHWKSALDA
jgi:putative MATE family efflux protein